MGFTAKLQFRLWNYVGTINRKCMSGQGQLKIKYGKKLYGIPVAGQGKTREILSE